MPTPAENLATSLEELKRLQDQGIIAIRAKDISRTHRERLLKTGFLKEVIKGWYISCHPNDMVGESTSWYTSFWGFCSSYFNERFSNNWCLSPEQSILLHTENWVVPNQLMVRSPKGTNKITKFLYETSILDVRYTMPDKKFITNKNGLNLYSLPAGLVLCSEKFFTQYPIDARSALSMLKDASEILDVLLAGGHSTIAGRLAGAFRNIGSNVIADNIIKTMQSIGYDVREIDPFETDTVVFFNSREKSPYVNRLRNLWYTMRNDIINIFPKPIDKRLSSKKYLHDIDEKYVLDAYHSLSIEGYKVSQELIERVRSGTWNPEYDVNDKEQINALAARGYWQAFQRVKQSIEKVLSGGDAGHIVSEDHRDWFLDLFSPSVAAGILAPRDLAGYRNSQVYIRHSKYVPPNKDAVRDLMSEFFELLERETEASVRIVLGHFLFVYIHPYMDGNGRLGRFLMNVMLASGGYPWLIIPIEKREEYMQALEAASVKQDIKPFCNFIKKLL